MDLTTRTETYAVGDPSWLASRHGVDSTDSVTLDTSAFTLGTHYPDGFFKSGLLLGKITATGKYGPYDNAAVDGRQTLVGLLMFTVHAPTDNTIDPAGAMLVHGKVINAKLPVTIDAAGITDVAGRIIVI
jgi:hypothetical protein